MRIAVVDDNKGMLDIIRMYIVRNKANIECECATFQGADKLLSDMESGRQYEVYFLDIEMPELNGLELAKRIRKLQNSACIVFLTCHEEFALKSYDIEIGAYQYVLKNEMKEKINHVLMTISGELENKREDFYIIQNERHYVKLKVVEIVYIYKESKNSVFVVQEGVYRERKALKKVLKDIGKSEFIFIDSGRIVNIKQIRRIEGNEICFMNGLHIYASYTSIKRLKDRINSYWRNLA